MILDADDIDAAQAYKLFIATVVPRPIAWVSTLSREGVANLAPFSFFTVVGRKPPLVSISVQRKSDGSTLKDTFVNIRDTGEFVINLVTLETADAMNRTAFEHAPEVDEFEFVGLDKAPSMVVKPPRVAKAPVAFECILDRIIPVGELGDHVIWGRVVRFHIRDDAYLEGGRVDTALLAPVGRLAAEYTLVDNVFTTPLEPALVTSKQGERMHRLDGRATDFSAVAQKEWSPSGSVTKK